MYGVVEISGHQFKVNPGDIIDVEKLETEVGKELQFDKVLFIGGEKIFIGLPTVSGAKITAKVIRQDRSDKILIMKRKPAGARAKKGHRQPYTALLITEINDGNGNIKKMEKVAKKAKEKPAQE